MTKVSKSVKISDTVIGSRTAIFSGHTSCGKTQLVLYLLEDDYKRHFNNIINFCPTISWNSTYRDRPSLWQNDYIFLINPKDQMFEWTGNFLSLLAGEEALFIVDHMIADENLDKRRQSIHELAITIMAFQAIIYSSPQKPLKAKEATHPGVPPQEAGHEAYQRLEECDRWLGEH